ncbi:MAG: hypothetical protein H0U21_10060, partial [Acidimicrobiia bacterium]|nr:hypothetical protein [Acidimicrobiia bacterium]
MSSQRVAIEGVLVSPDHLIDGERVESSRTFEDRSPLDWSRVLAHVARGDAATADAGDYIAGYSVANDYGL